ncbi:MAG TPA: fibronectin type III domain-containing protein [Candidatus Lokiarchaeia archaeon]|nr:fibronectin type III domain-containing protein [Candidatus Lokiarchaeia archaeon]
MFRLLVVGTFSSTSGNNIKFANGTGYYVVTAVNGSGESGISNCQSVGVRVYLPHPPSLNVPFPNPSTNGTLFLSWTASSGATSYKLYRYTSTITTLNGSVVLVGTFSSISGVDTGLTNGTWYYVVIAVNASGESVISNCVNGVVQIHSEHGETNLFKVMDILQYYRKLVDGRTIKHSVIQR